jgi:hypothetical protein
MSVNSKDKKRHGLHGLHRYKKSVSHVTNYYPIHWAKSSALTSDAGMVFPDPCPP